MNHDTRSRAYERVARLGEADLDLPELFDELTRILATALPHESECWHTMDPATLIETAVHADGMPTPDVRVATFAYRSDDYNTFSGLIAGPRHSGLLSEATGGDLQRSIRYRELMRPHDMYGELRTAFVVDGSSWGCFAFFRDIPRDFTEDEKNFAHDLAPALGRAFRSAGVRARTAGVGAELWPGMLLLDERGQVETFTAPARTWLQDLGFTGEPDHDPLPFALFAVAERVSDTGRSASARIRGASGRWIQVHGAPAAGGATGRVAIVMQPATAPAIAPLLSAAYGFTSRERELTELVLQGCDTGEIAARLFISRHTVQGHLKSIFAKTGVRSRRDLVGRVFVSHEDARP